jgi:peptide/nickel transport system permease protein
MGLFILKRIGVMVLTALFMTLIVFYLTNLGPNLEKLAKNQLGPRISDQEVTSWLDRNGYAQPLLSRYGEWLGVLPGFVHEADDGTVTGRCIKTGMTPEDAPRFCGVLQGDWGYSIKYRVPVGEVISERLARTGILMFWAFAVMVPLALIVGVMAGMREGSGLDRTLSTFSIATTSTPEYVSGVIFVVLSSSRAGISGCRNGSSARRNRRSTGSPSQLHPAGDDHRALRHGLYRADDRASMAEVMTAQYIRTARLKGVSFRNIVLRHALRNALIAPFTVIMLQFPWLLTGVVIVETLFVYPGFGDALVQGRRTMTSSCCWPCRSWRWWWCWSPS